MQRSEKNKPQKILVVDGSRVVRASLARCVGKSHGVCEEHDVESAWQSLVLDTGIVAVISGLGVASEDGAGLLERIRTNRLSRIKNLPFYLLASDNLSESERQRAQGLGVTAFIPKKAPAATLAELLAPQQDTVGIETEVNCDNTIGIETGIGCDSTIGIDDLGARIERMAGLGPVATEVAGVAEAEPQAGRGHPLKRCLEQHLNKKAGSQTASVLVFGIDGYDKLCERFGQRIAEKVVSKFSSLLRSKVGAKENMLPLADGRIGIASSNIDREQCTTFARRVCKALAAATLSVGREQIKATVSAGVAAMPQDGSGLSAEELFYLATGRLDAAVAAGGNQIVHTDGGGKNLRQKEFIARLASLLIASPPEAEMPCKSWLRSICVACRDARPEGELPPCSAGPVDGLCGDQQTSGDLD